MFRTCVCRKLRSLTRRVIHNELYRSIQTTDHFDMCLLDIIRLRFPFRYHIRWNDSDILLLNYNLGKHNDSTIERWIKKVGDWVDLIKLHKYHKIDYQFNENQYNQFPVFHSPLYDYALTRKRRDEREYRIIIGYTDSSFKTTGLVHSSYVNSFGRGELLSLSLLTGIGFSMCFSF